MPLTYEESAGLMTDAGFRSRIKVACMKYANYILEEAITVPAHNTRIKWAQGCMSNPESTAAAVQPTVVMDPQVQADGAAITDEALQTSVESSLNKLL